MGRIRTIKPEFPHSESMGRVSREARLLYILIWTLADDVGRLRGNSRMLASLLYPYDDDAKDHIDTWLNELHMQGCISRYEVDACQYIEIAEWLTHQKIDKPSPSKLPPIPEDSRPLANPRESYAADQGKDQGREWSSREESSSRIAPAAQANTTKSQKKPQKTAMPSNFSVSDRVQAWASEKGFDALDAHLESFKSKVSANGYVYADWDAAFMNAVRDDWAGIRKGRNGAATNHVATLLNADVQLRPESEAHYG